MAGFFGLFDYTKPGKGVDPDAPKKHPFFLFWELIWRKLSRLILLNLIYFVCILPILSFLYTRFYSVILSMIDSAAPDSIALGPLPSIMASFSFSIPFPLFVALLILSVVLYGPVTCGFTYMMRNFTREEHAWFSDFFTKAKENFKQGVAIGILELLIYTVFILNLTMDSSAVGSNALFTVAKYVSLFLVVFFTFMRYYFYTMVVTFRLTVWQILKNAIIFAVLGIFRNILVTVVIVLTAGALIVFSGWAEFALIPLFMFSFWGFLITFTCYPVIKKYMIDPLNAEDGAGEEPASLEAGDSGEEEN